MLYILFFDFYGFICSISISLLDYIYLKSKFKIAIFKYLYLWCLIWFLFGALNHFRDFPKKENFLLSFHMFGINFPVSFL